MRPPWQSGLRRFREAQIKKNFRVRLLSRAWDDFNAQISMKYNKILFHCISFELNSSKICTFTITEKKGIFKHFGPKTSNVDVFFIMISEK